MYQLCKLSKTFMKNLWLLLLCVILASCDAVKFSDSVDKKNVYDAELIDYLNRKKIYTRSVSALDTVNDSLLDEYISTAQEQALEFMEQHKEEFIEGLNIDVSLACNEEEIERISQNSALIQEWLQSVFSKDFYDAYMQLINDDQAINNVEDIIIKKELSGAEKFILAESCIYADWSEKAMYASNSKNDKCLKDRVVMEGLCLVALANEYAVSLAMAELPPAAAVTFTAATVTYIGCMITAHNLYKKCVTN